jgi:hypothetical protein
MTFDFALGSRVCQSPRVPRQARQVLSEFALLERPWLQGKKPTLRASVVGQSAAARGHAKARFDLGQELNCAEVTRGRLSLAPVRDAMTTLICNPKI